MPCLCRCFIEAVKKQSIGYTLEGWWENALGLAAESPQRSEDLQRKARPER